jgi:hypothetical protein
VHVGVLLDNVDWGWSQGWQGAGVHQCYRRLLLLLRAVLGYLLILMLLRLLVLLLLLCWVHDWSTCRGSGAGKGHTIAEEGSKLLSWLNHICSPEARAERPATCIIVGAQLGCSSRYQSSTGTSKQHITCHHSH